jgi:molybdopterin synthase sulfur carrier subunit
MNLTVQYFAILREQRGVSQEKISTNAATSGALYAELRARHNFTLGADRIRAAVNDEFVSSDSPLREGDRVAFIPPVAGG